MFMDVEEVIMGSEFPIWEWFNQIVGSCTKHQMLRSYLIDPLTICSMPATASGEGSAWVFVGRRLEMAWYICWEEGGAMFHLMVEPSSLQQHFSGSEAEDCLTS